MDYLSISTSDASPSRFDLRRNSVRIGRGRDCAIQIRDPLASRHHARVFRADDRWWVEDVGSRNGTFINGRQVKGREPLDRGDRIEIGETALTFESDVDRLDQTWAEEPVLSSPAREETYFEDSVEPQRFREQEFDRDALESLFRISSILGAGLRLPQLVREVLRAVRTSFEADAACLFLTDQMKKPLRPALVLSDERSPMISQTVVWHSVQTRRAVCVRNSAVELPSEDILNVMAKTEPRSVMCAPLLYGDRLLGAILVDRQRPDAFDRHSLSLFTAMAHLFANALQQIRETEKLESAALAARSEVGMIEALAGSSNAIEALHQRIEEVAGSDEPVLVTGEYGTGKHEAARRIHLASARAGRPQMWLPALALAPEQIAPTLFGVASEDGTDEDAPGSGLLESAHGGTLVISEIAGLPADVQGQILQYLRTLKFQRVGSERRFFSDARLVATSSQPLEAEVEAERFDPDLLKAISSHVIRVPPLRERTEDITTLAVNIARQIAPRAGRREIALTSSFLRSLHSYEWPGNVRELQNVIERAVLCSHGENLGPSDLPMDLVHEVKKKMPSTIFEDADFDPLDSMSTGDR